ncbi:MAG TPA: hypothetical protein PLO24_13375, partial [Bacteroidales bacterium]|nr:hypothetical protein [Bacteroidales bacterium]
MKKLLLLLPLVILAACAENKESMKKIIFLNHSTGYAVWLGNTNNYIYKITRKGDVQKYVNKHSRKNKSAYLVTQRFFPSREPYGWKNYPFDYYNIWVKNAGNKPYMEESTLEILTAEYDLIMFKHCFPVSNIQADTGNPDINSEVKSLENYKLQYEALKNKMRQFPDNQFIVWTPAVNTRNLMSEDEAIRTKEFRDWIVNEWDEKGDNIFVWDFYSFETEGGLYLADKNAVSLNDSHPNTEFSARMASLLGQFIIDV